MLNLNSTLSQLCSAREAGAQELLNLKHLQFVPISSPALLMHWFKDRTGLPSLSWQAALQTLPAERVPAFGLQARKGLWDLPQPAVGVCQGSQWAHGATPAVPTCPFLQAAPAVLCQLSSHGTALGMAPQRAFAVMGSLCNGGNRNIYPKLPWVTPKLTLL